MNSYLALKVVHVVSATILFGAGLGTAFFKWAIDRSGRVAAMRVVAEKVVLADWLFTTPAILVQIATGVALARLLGYPLTRGWVACALVLYFFAGACWIPVVLLQLRMRDLARAADQRGTALEEHYWAYARAWFWLGVLAFTSIIVVFWLMIAKPP